MFAYGRYYGNAFAEMVDPNAINSGTCYRVVAGSVAAMPTTCSDGGGSGVTYGALPTFVGLKAVYQGIPIVDPTKHTLRRRNVRVLRCGKRRVRPKQHGVACVYRVLDYGSVESERQAELQLRHSRRQLQFGRGPTPIRGRLAISGLTRSIRTRATIRRRSR